MTFVEVRASFLSEKKTNLFLSLTRQFWSALKITGERFIINKCFSISIYEIMECDTTLLSVASASEEVPSCGDGKKRRGSIAQVDSVIPEL